MDVLINYIKEHTTLSVILLIVVLIVVAILVWLIVSEVLRAKKNKQRLEQAKAQKAEAERAAETQTEETAPQTEETAPQAEEEAPAAEPEAAETQPQEEEMKKETAKAAAPKKTETKPAAKAAVAVKTPAKKEVSGANGKWVITKDGDRFGFELVASNGEVMLESSISYSSLAGAKGGIKTYQTNIAAGRLEIKETKNGFRVQILNGSNALYAASADYKTRASCESACESIKRWAATAVVVVEGEDEAK